VTSPDLARRLHDAGLAWSPSNGDRFWLPDSDLDQAVFLVSDMVVEVRDVASGRVLAFNGTTEWALDGVEEHEAVWLPRLDQLLEVLGAHFLSLSARSGGHVVRVQVGHAEEEHVDVELGHARAGAIEPPRVGDHGSPGSPGNPSMLRAFFSAQYATRPSSPLRVAHCCRVGRSSR
jgi:hypothetical protein